MALPAAGYISDQSRTSGEVKQALEDMRDVIADDDVSAVYAYAVSQLAAGDDTKVGFLVNGTVVDTLDYVVYPADLTIWATSGATGTSDGTLNTGTGAAGGVAGTLTLMQYDKYDNSTSGLTATTQQAAIDESYAATLALSGKVTASGSATFTNSTNNISLTGIGLDVEIGDVIQIGGSANNSGEFTIEFITDNDNVIVNAAHAGKSRTVAPIGEKALIDETATVVVTLLAKWFHAGPGLGQGWVDVTFERSAGVTYPNNTNREIKSTIRHATANSIADTVFKVGLSDVYWNEGTGGGTYNFTLGVIPIGKTKDYILNLGSGSIVIWKECR